MIKAGGEVHDLASAKIWITDVLMLYQSKYELPILYRLYEAWQTNNTAAING